MNVAEIREKYLAFCKKNGHAIIPSASLMPDGDATTLFIGSGMQPLLPYLLGQKHPHGTRVANSQKCFRAEDLEEVGDNRHTTFFEMLGNWSFGDYFKKEQLAWFFAFLVDEVGLDPSRIYVTCFIGDQNNDIPQDTESAQLWQRLFEAKGITAPIVTIGTEARGYEQGMGDGRIFYYNAAKNWWSRSGTPDMMPAGEPGGPDSEVFYDFGTPHDSSFGAQCHPNCDCGRFMEIGNSVFMEYIKNPDGTFALLPQKNVDFGGGLERITAAANDCADVFLVDVFATLIAQLEALSAKKYAQEQYAFRIIADHLRGAVHMIADGIVPSNKEQGYVLRRLLRRAIFYAQKLSIAQEKLTELVPTVIALYKEHYSTLGEKEAVIVDVIKTEEKKFHKTLVRGLKEFEKMVANDGSLSGKDAFVLFTTYGFPLEMTLELAQDRGLDVNRETYTKEFEKHRERSRSASAGKFKGGLADASAQTTALHTCTHLMLAGLRKELGDHVHQAGSNITAERTRFDFTHPEKVDRATLDRVENYVNDAIAHHAHVRRDDMDKEQAQAEGVEGSFWEKYPQRVHVYSVVGEDGTVYSKELCGGPHVASLDEISGVFKIVKEKSSGAGVRRIKAQLIL